LKKGGQGGFALASCVADNQIPLNPPFSKGEVSLIGTPYHAALC